MPHKKNLTTTSLAVSVQFIERRIYLIRGHKVMIDVDLAELYGVPTKYLNQQVRRNQKRFPEDFMFQLTKEEAEVLRLQIATSRSAIYWGFCGILTFEVTNCDLKIPIFIGKSALEVANCDLKNEAGDPSRVTCLQHGFNYFYFVCRSSS